MKRFLHLLAALFFSSAVSADVEMKYLDRTLICKSYENPTKIEKCYHSYLTTGVESRTIGQWFLWSSTNLYSDRVSIGMRSFGDGSNRNRELRVSCIEGTLGVTIRWYRVLEGLQPTIKHRFDFGSIEELEWNRGAKELTSNKGPFLVLADYRELSEAEKFQKELDRARILSQDELDSRHGDFHPQRTQLALPEVEKFVENIRHGERLIVTGTKELSDEDSPPVDKTMVFVLNGAYDATGIVLQACN